MPSAGSKVIAGQVCKLFPGDSNSDLSSTAPPILKYDSLPLRPTTYLLGVKLTWFAVCSNNFYHFRKNFGKSRMQDIEWNLRDWLLLAVALCRQNSVIKSSWDLNMYVHTEQHQNNQVSWTHLFSCGIDGRGSGKHLQMLQASPSPSCWGSTCRWWWSGGGSSTASYPGPTPSPSTSPVSSGQRRSRTFTASPPILLVAQQLYRPIC